MFLIFSVAPFGSGLSYLGLQLHSARPRAAPWKFFFHAIKLYHFRFMIVYSQNCIFVFQSESRDDYNPVTKICYFVGAVYLLLNFMFLFVIYLGTLFELIKAFSMRKFELNRYHNHFNRIINEAVRSYVVRKFAREKIEFI